ncbi:hypothetical protein NUU61_003160 [Penicillium alfredii]|uniref:Uncharacterized protein n=1 Tax=Penicillium alfredii TaxID=1506179 RepID=A0A9W9FT12_9EURO|nr:uncharacterized protein NUU61_003160 [Penicillium alfredii]KAJ5105813.1 hypothetical protein NUU61_003160 [Penicillium alfredii]
MPPTPAENQALQRSTFQTTIYLSEPYTGSNLIPASNTDRTKTATLTPLTVHRDRSTTTHQHQLLPLSTHPALNRLYVPSKPSSDANKETTNNSDSTPASRYSNQINKSKSKKGPAESTKWVGMALTPGQRWLTAEDFIEALDQSIETLGQSFMIDRPEQSPVPCAFLMEIRGVFRDRLDVLASAQRHVDLLEQLIRSEVIVLGDGVLLS